MADPENVQTFSKNGQNRWFRGGKIFKIGVFSEVRKIDSFQAGGESKSGGSKSCRHWTCAGYPAMVKSVFEIGSKWWRSAYGGIICAFLRRECIKKSRKNGIFLKIGVVEENVRKGLLCAQVDLEKVKKRHFFKDWSGGGGPYGKVFCAVCRREEVAKK